MRVSIVNPRKKARKSHARKGKKRHNPAKPHVRRKRVARKGARKRRANPGKTTKRRKMRKARKGYKRKTKASRRKVTRKARKRKNPKTRRRKARRARKNPAPAKRIRPVFYRSKGKSYKHSPKSRLASKGYRFNPGLHGVVKMKGAKLDIPHIGGGVVGFVAAGYVGGVFTRFMQKSGQSELIANGAGLVGNAVGTEISAYAVHYAVGKLMKKPSLAVPVARGVRVGGYIALALNAVSMGLKVLNIPLPFRALGSGSPAKDVVLSGLGDLDLAVKGAGASSDFCPMDYAALDDESDSLNAEINALSAYLGDAAPSSIAGLIGGGDL